MDRRSFLKFFGAAAATTAAGLVLPELIAEPRRKIWQVGRNAPVPSLFDNLGSFFNVDAPGYPAWDPSFVDSGTRLAMIEQREREKARLLQEAFARHDEIMAERIRSQASYKWLRYCEKSGTIVAD